MLKKSKELMINSKLEFTYAINVNLGAIRRRYEVEK